MVDRILNRVLDSVALRMIVIGLVVALPAGLSTGWLGAAYQAVVWNADFAPTMLRMVLAGMPAVLVCGLVVLYPLERWLLRDRAVKSWGWVALRIALYIAAGLPMGLGFLWSMRLGTQRFEAIIESSYFVIAITNAGVAGLLYSLLERILAEIKRREAKLQSQIEQLQIEIDRARRDRQVQEITETEYFMKLRSMAQQMRRQANATQAP